MTRGLLAGVAGTAAMTGVQAVVSHARGSSGGDGGEPGWDDAPAPAVVAKRLVEGVFRVEVPASRIRLVTNVVHWAYGTGWGAVYGLVQGTVRAHPVAHGLAFGAAVWGASYAQLVPLGLYEPPWEYGPKTLAPDLAYHGAYGLATAAAFAALD